MSWSDIAQFVVAAATLLLALATFRMAKQTRRVAEHTREESHAVAEEVRVARDQVAATNRQAELARAALAASIQPWLTKAEERDVKGDGSVWIAKAVVGIRGPEVVISFLLKNVGSGVALIERAVLRSRDRSTSELAEQTYTAFFTAPVLRPDGDTSIVFHWAPHGEDPARVFDVMTGRPGIWGELFVDVLYTDATGEQATWAIVHLTATAAAADAEWVVHAIDYRRDDEDTPFAHVEFMS